MRHVSGHISLRFVQIIMALVLALIILLPASWKFGVNNFFWPHLLLIAIYFWSLLAPSWLPSVYIVFLGVFHDILYDLPFGLTAILLLLIRLSVVQQRQYLIVQPFVIQWFAFAVHCIVFLFVNWVIISLYYQQLVFSDSIIIKGVLTVIVYPLIHQFNLWIYSRVKPAIRQYKSRR